MNIFPNRKLSRKEDAVSKTVVIGISGGKDSGVVAGLFNEAIGDEGIKPFKDVLEKFPRVAFEFYNFNIKSYNCNQVESQK